MEESLSVLTRANRLRYDGKTYSAAAAASEAIDHLWQKWDAQKQLWAQDPALKAQLVLAEATLRALPDIVTGKVPATDVMFPESSMELVEGIYKNNPVADYFNQCLADTVAAYLEQRIGNDASDNASGRIRILEIGAGTGGTSAAVLKKMAV